MVEIESRKEGKTIRFWSGNYNYFVNLVKIKDSQKDMVVLNVNRKTEGGWVKINSVWFTPLDFKEFVKLLTEMQNKMRTFTPIGELQKTFKDSELRTETRKIVEGS